jgi:transcriptional regulator with XRE-family HTH domain
VAGAPSAGEDVAEGGLVDTNEAGEIGLAETSVLEPLIQPGARLPDECVPPLPAPPIHDRVINTTVPAVKSIRANMADVTATTERANKRFLQLINELGAEEGAPGHGWKSRVARRLGVNPSYISILARSVRVTVGADSIEKACAHLRLHRDYFYGIRTPASYKDFVIAGTEPRYQAWREFREGPIGRSITEAERVALVSIVVPDGSEPTAAFYEGMLYMIQKRLTRSEALAGIEMSAETDRKLAQKRKPKS